MVLVFGASIQFLFIYLFIFVLSDQVEQKARLFRPSKSFSSKQFESGQTQSLDLRVTGSGQYKCQLNDRLQIQLLLKQKSLLPFEVHSFSYSTSVMLELTTFLLVSKPSKFSWSMNMAGGEYTVYYR